MKTKVTLILSILILTRLSLWADPSGTDETVLNGGTDRVRPIKNGNKYENWIETKLMEGSLLSAAWNWIKGGEKTVPEDDIPVVPLTRASFAGPSEELKVRWLGHSSVLVELGGLRILIDPVLSRYASPIPGFVKRFSRAPLPAEELPKIDLVLLSHDHYDHLEKTTVKALAGQGAAFFVPEGVGRHLKDWEIPEDLIHESTWWQESVFHGIKIVCAPSRHFSGRSLFGTDETLWSGWIIDSLKGKIFYSGDTGYADHFGQIGRTCGPFDLTILKIGAYDKGWPEIHIDPEQAVRAHGELRGKLLLPVHWATFDLALHPWDEPILRAVKAAEAAEVRLVTPRIGEVFGLGDRAPKDRWWEGLK